MASSSCSYCGGPTVYDPDSSATVCSACGREIATEFFTDSHNPNDPSSFVSADFTYHQRKRHRAETLISDLCSRLQLSARYSAETLALISDLTSSSFGAGDWFSVLTAAAVYVVSRRHSLPLSVHEVAAAVSCDHHQIGRMVLRILSFLDSGQLPDFDAASALDRAIQTCPSFSDLESVKKEELVKMGRFLIQCMTKWFLMTGRRPVPAVVAVAAFVAEVNGIMVDIKEIAKDIYAPIGTSRIRLTELKETLVKAARALLPWGQDVNLKNLVHNMPLLIRFMESKARFVRRPSGSSERFQFNLDHYLTVYSNSDDKEEDSGYFRIGYDGVSCEELDSVEISGERLSSAYKNVLDQIADVRDSGCFDNVQAMKRRRTIRELEDEGSWESWEGRWELGKKLTLKQVLEKDVGYDPLPPSFVSGMDSRERRKVKIEAAKHRINRTRNPMSATDFTLVAEEDERPLVPTVGRSRSKREARINGVDWEDCIIELLLLHQVDEEEIESGQYSRLLDLHIFTSLSSVRTER